MLTFDEVTARRGVEFASDEEREAVRARFEVLTAAVDTPRCPASCELPSDERDGATIRFLR